MKISAYHKQLGDLVEWANVFEEYDIIYKSKVFAFTEKDNYHYQSKKIICGGTGYGLDNCLSNEIEYTKPDYSIYPFIDKKTAYGFLTRGCPNKCKWCIVPKKEGSIKPYMDVDDIAIDGRTNLILMDNNILSSDYGLSQIQKIIDRKYRVDFNQALDARLVTNDIAKLLAKVKWLNQIRFGCDTYKQIKECERAMSMIDEYRGKPMQYLLYTMIDNDINEAYTRLSYFKNNKRVRIVAQPFRDFNNPKQIIPQWQKDMARWAMRRELYAVCDFKEYQPRKGFSCDMYFND
jgi:ribosomal protein L31E